MQPIKTEAHKNEGICYAFTDDGIKLPVIDVSHPAFAIKLIYFFHPMKK